MRLLQKRELTGCARRKEKRNAPDTSRAMHLSTAEVGLRSLIQKGIITAHNESRAAYVTIAPLISLVCVFIHNGRTEQAAAAAHILLRQVRKYNFKGSLVLGVWRRSI